MQSGQRGRWPCFTSVAAWVRRQEKQAAQPQLSSVKSGGSLKQMGHGSAGGRIEQEGADGEQLYAVQACCVSRSSSLYTLVSDQVATTKQLTRTWLLLRASWPVRPCSTTRTAAAAGTTAAAGRSTGAGRALLPLALQPQQECQLSTPHRRCMKASEGCPAAAAASGLQRGRVSPTGQQGQHCSGVPTLKSQLQRSEAFIVGLVNCCARLQQGCHMALAAACRCPVQCSVARGICVVRACPCGQQRLQHFRMAGPPPAGCFDERGLASCRVAAINRRSSGERPGDACHAALLCCIQKTLLWVGSPQQLGCQLADGPCAGGSAAASKGGSGGWSGMAAGRCGEGWRARQRRVVCFLLGLLQPPMLSALSSHHTTASSKAFGRILLVRA